jgi:hypothetical protein
MKRIGSLGLVTALVVLLAAASVADARHRRHRHALNVTFRVATVQTNADGSFIDAGIGSDGSALVVRGSVSGTTVTDTTVNYTTRGTSRTTDTFTATANPDGSVTFSGTGKFLSGTGILRGITGTYTITGSQAAGDTVSVVHIKGTATY